MSIVPHARPQTSREGVLSFVLAGTALPPFPFLVGRRGYYADSMGRPGVNDLNVYDDAMWIVERSDLHAFNANCDPGRHAQGMANLTAGLWYYRPGTHNLSKGLEHRYPALVQAGPVVVHRDDTESFALGTRHPKYGECVGRGQWKGLFGINIHRGGHGVTSSLGCQTIPPSQWDAFMHGIHAALDREQRNEKGRDTLAYILTERAT